MYCLVVNCIFPAPAGRITQCGKEFGWSAESVAGARRGGDAARQRRRPVALHQRPAVGSGIHVYHEAKVHPATLSLGEEGNKPTLRFKRGPLNQLSVCLSIEKHPSAFSDKLAKFSGRSPRPCLSTARSFGGGWDTGPASQWPRDEQQCRSLCDPQNHTPAIVHDTPASGGRA